MKANKKSSMPEISADSGLMLFIREIISNPSAMGAACPSSKKLAEHIASQVPLNEGLVLELGGGTGVITHALLQRGVNPEQLIVVERSASLAQHLQERFPQVHIIHGDARSLSELLKKQTRPISAIVSGLPLRSLPKSTVDMIGSQLETLLLEGALYIQFTYSLYRQPLSPTSRLHCMHKEYIWRNFPPARVDVFHYVDQ